MKKIFFGILTLLIFTIIYSVYIFFWSQTNGHLNEIKILSNCASKKIPNQHRVEKFGLAFPSIACLIRDYKSDEFLENDELIMDVMSLSKSCQNEFVIDKKEQLFCYQIFKEILQWFDVNNIKVKFHKTINAQILNLDKQIEYNISSPWEEIFPELKDISQSQIRKKLIWLFSKQMREEWKLSTSDLQHLINENSDERIKSWLIKANNNEKINISNDTIKRLNLLYGIYSILIMNTNSDNEDIGPKWFILQNNDDYFQGSSPKLLLINSGELLTYYALRFYVEENSTLNQASK
jgi:hypothetical protein